MPHGSESIYSLEPPGHNNSKNGREKAVWVTDAVATIIQNDGS